ncbi:MAG TPA: methylated-DNA--[protein]-cysteine S-methyltransferase [Sedimentisphaerales bacterium]|jgi:methylated-DNA-[protein]-cysteine S-methyltransferase|nr:methylated-DNA--[protein]-cysteine S-methyltransferase [Sedimentisphaerales bacterium]
MEKIAKYVIFETKWGHFGLAGSESALCRTCLPGRASGTVKSQLLKNLPDAQFDGSLFKTMQEQITAYFEGSRVSFSPEIPVALDGLSEFSRLVLTTCRNVEFGQTVTYSDLAKRLGRPAASRAVGGALARNPLPLLIPCHRVIRSDGKMGGFSAPGGISLKKKMLELERQALKARISRSPL